MPLPGTVPAAAPAPLHANPLVLEEKVLEDAEGSSAAGLTEDEKNIIKQQLDAPNEHVGYFSLFRYANKKEALIMLVSLVASVAAGAAMPLMTVSLACESAPYLSPDPAIACVR